MQRRVPTRPRADLPAPEPRDGGGERGAALRERAPVDVGAAHFAQEGREVARVHPHVGGGERAEMLRGGDGQFARPGQVEHALAAARLDRLPQHGRLAGPRPPVHDADGTFVLDELELHGRPGSSDEIGVVDLALREAQIIVQNARVERFVIVVVAHRAHEDAAAAGELDAAGGPASLHRPPQVVLHAAAAAEGRAAPAAVRRVPASLDDGRAPVRGQMLQHDAQALAQVRPFAEAVRHVGVDPQAVRQAAERQLAPGAGVAPQHRPARRSRARQGERSRRRRPRIRFAEGLRDLPALVAGQRERGIPDRRGRQSEHPPRGSGHLALVHVENARQLRDRLRLHEQWFVGGPRRLIIDRAAVCRATARRPASRRETAGRPRCATMAGNADAALVAPAGDGRASRGVRRGAGAPGTASRARGWR